ncbi:MAG: LruC domain-containing protein [Fibrobacterales bacterium]
MNTFIKRVTVPFSIAILSLFNGCDTSTPITGNENNTDEPTLTFSDISAPKGFAFSVYNEKGLTVRLSVDSEEGILPYEGATIRVVDGSTNDLLASFITDVNGEVLYDGANLSSDVNKVGISVYAAGIPEDTLWYTKEQLTTLDRIVIVNPTTYDTNEEQSTVAAKASVISRIEEVDGVVYGKEKHPRKDFRLVSGALFVERSKLDPIPAVWQGTKEIHINALTNPNDKDKIWAHFMHTGAGYQNAFGYYWYKKSENPTGALSGINRVTLFGLVDGFYSIRKRAPKALVGTVTEFKSRLADANDEIVIGFWLHADYEQGNKPTNPIWYSNTAYNVQAHGAAEEFHHVSFPSRSDETEFVFAIEDLRTSNSDEDYNDLILIIDDVAPSEPCDIQNDPSCITCSDLPYNKKSRFAFEDQYPNYGDFDYNDVVVDVDYSFVSRKCNLMGSAILDNTYGAKYAPQLVSGSVAVTPVANGALYSLGFAVSLGNSFPGATVVVDNSASDVVEVADEVIIEFFDFMRAQFDRTPSTILVNTDPLEGSNSAPAYSANATFTATITFAQGTAIPANMKSVLKPFIYFNDDVSKEIHLKNGILTARGVAQNLVGTPAEGHSYEDGNGIPWAIELNQNTLYPVEFQDFADAYPFYASWVQTGEPQDWATQGNDSVLY